MKNNDYFGTKYTYSDVTGKIAESRDIPYGNGLGCNRIVMDTGDNVRQVNNYYPFGMPHQVVYPPLDGITPEFQPYKFGSKEYDEMHGF